MKDAKTKKCSKCKEVKSVNEFNKQTGSKDGLRYDCRKCQSKCRKKYYKRNSEKAIIYASQWTRDNPGWRKEWEGANLKQIRRTGRKWNENNPEKVKLADKKYRKTHKKEINERQKKRRENDLIYRLNNNMGCLIRDSLRDGKNGRHWETLVGYTLNDLIKHLESRFTEGMTWENHGKGKNKWNIDHIIAISRWNITSYECQDFKDCWALKNLQPLWTIRNEEKGDKLMHPKYLIKPEELVCF